MARRKTASSVGRPTARNSKFLVFWMIVIAITTFTLSLTYLSNAWEKTTYYVLNQDVLPRTLITVDMLEARTTSAGTEPAGIPISEIQTGSLFSKFSLFEGDVPTYSNVGPLDDISVGVPDEWVITSFPVNADDAVGGRITRGVYFDMMVIDGEEASYPFVNILALDTTVSLDRASSSQAVDTAEARSGQTEQYYVGMSPENAAILQSIVNSGKQIKLVLSPRQNEYAEPQLASYRGLFTPEGRDGEGLEVTNQGLLTDNTFQRVERDEQGKPVQSEVTCELEGNRKLSEEDCLAVTNGTPNVENDSETSEEPATNEENDIDF